ncbi:hypothetical protein EMIT0P253_350015 [Pseudomonas sp. IT-P253]
MMRPDAKVEKVYLYPKPAPSPILSLASQPPVELIIMVTAFTHLRLTCPSTNPAAV